MGRWNKGTGSAILAIVIGGSMIVAVMSDCKVVFPIITPNPPVVTDQSDCASACDNLKFLGCKEGNPIDMGTTCHVDADCKDVHGVTDTTQACSALGTCMTTCVNFCTVTENQGVWLDPSCVAKVTSCDQIEQCPAPVPATGGNSCTGAGCKVAPSSTRR
jgi:hypothetical protein